MQTGFAIVRKYVYVCIVGCPLQMFQILAVDLQLILCNQSLGMKARNTIPTFIDLALADLYTASFICDTFNCDNMHYSIVMGVSGRAA